MKRSEIISWLIVGALSAVLIFVSVKKFDCSRCEQSVIADTVYIDRPIETLVEVPVKIPIYHTKVKYDTLWKENNIDTLEILRRYFEECMAVWFYTDTIQDTSFYAIINDSIQGSDITYRQFQYGIKKYKEITKTVTLNDNGFYAGAIIGRSKNEFGFGASLSYKHDKNIFGINYDLLNKDIYLSYQRKLRFSRETSIRY